MEKSMKKHLTGGDDDNTIAKQASISYLRIFATICVIWLHTCSTLCDNPQLFILDKEQNIFFNASYQMMYWAVPVFFMITGMLFLREDMKIKTSDWIAKYARRILFALVIFGLPYSALKMVGTVGLDIRLLGKSIITVLSDTGFGHLWYLYILVAIYCVLPVLKRFCGSATDGEHVLVLASLFVLNFFTPLISRLSDLEIAFR